MSDEHKIVVGPVTDPSSVALLKRSGANVLFARMVGGCTESLNTSAVLRLQEEMGASELGIWIDQYVDARRASDFVRCTNPKYLLVDSRSVQSSVVKAIRDCSEAKVILGGFDMEHDDWDAEFMIELIAEEQRMFLADYSILAVLPEIKSPTSWFRTEAGRYDDDFRLEDLKDMLQRLPLIVSVSDAEDNFRWLAKELRAAQGFFFAVDDGGSVDRALGPIFLHRGETTSLAQAVQCMKQLK